jgi:hypothetical protein
MSTAYYPQGMRTMPSGGRKNASLPSQYISWKGTGSFSNPVGIAPTHIRPLTNKDSGNVFKSGSFPSRYPQNTRTFIPRPLKHYRRGRVIPSAEITNPTPNDPVGTMEINLINYNMVRNVKSSKGTPLGNGRWGHGLLADLQENPGGYIVKQNPPDEKNGAIQLNKDCKTCQGVGVVVNYMPNTPYLTENPVAKTQTNSFCCNEQYKAKRRAIYASTNLKKNYYTTTKQYLQNRCQTFEQKSFNFQDNKTYVTESLSNSGFTAEEIDAAKPGSALSQFNVYEANCYPNSEILEATENTLVFKIITLLVDKAIISNTQANAFINLNIIRLKHLIEYINSLPEDVKSPALAVISTILSNSLNFEFGGPYSENKCKLTVYKPNNYQFAKQGSVSSSTRMLKLNVDTISTNAASLNRKNNTGNQLYNANDLYRGKNNYVANLYKNKSQSKCSAPPAALIHGVYHHKNKKICSYQAQLPSYRNPISQPSPYRYYDGPVFSTNHFSQTPRTYQTSSRSV